MSGEYDLLTIVIPNILVGAVIIYSFIQLGVWSFPRIRKAKPMPYHAQWWPGDMFLRDRLNSFWEEVEKA